MNKDRDYLLMLQSVSFPKNHTKQDFLTEWKISVENSLGDKLKYTVEDFCYYFDITLEQFNALTSPAFKDLINQKLVIEPFLASLKQDTHKTLKNVVVGSLRKEKIKAETFLGPFGQPVVIFHDGLIWMIDHFKWIQVFRKVHKFQPFARSYYMEELGKLQYFYFSDGNMDVKLMRGELPLEVLVSRTIEVQFMKLFIFAHEYAHVLLGHLKHISNDIVSIGKEPISTEFKRYTINQVMEFDADELAYQWYKDLLTQDNILTAGAAMEQMDGLLVLPFELMYFLNLVQGPKLVMNDNFLGAPFLERFKRLYHTNRNDFDHEKAKRIEEMLMEGEKQIEMMLQMKRKVAPK
jgi:hypothetical protein